MGILDHSYLFFTLVKNQTSNVGIKLAKIILLYSNAAQNILRRCSKLNKIKNINEAISKINDGSTVMIGGFLNCGAPEELIDEIVEKGVKNLTIIANDTSFPDTGIGKLIVNKQAKKVIASYIGANRETGNQMNKGELDVELVPQGTLAERIRSHGVGLGGALTPTGVGTVVETRKEKIVIDGKEYLLEKPISADIALVKAWKADESGNLVYHYSARNFNPLIAMAADLVIVEAEEIVPMGELEPNEIMTPGIFVDYVVNLD